MTPTPVPPETLAAFDAKAKAKIMPVDYVTLLHLETLSTDAQEAAARAFRVRGIDAIIADLKKTLPTEEATALNRFLRMCPRVDELTNHILEYKQSAKLLKAYIAKLHNKIEKL